MISKKKENSSVNFFYIYKIIINKKWFFLHNKINWLSKKWFYLQNKS